MMSHDDYEESLKVIDTAKILTMDELFELKKLAQLSKVSRYVAGISIGIISVFGIPSIIDWASHHIK
jgi:hypothetical protein